MANVVKPSDDEGETFNFENVSDSSESSAVSAHVRPTGSGRRTPATAVADTEPPIVPIAATTSKNPINAAPSIPTTGSNRAQDIHYFYSKRQIDVKGVMTMRNVCTLCW